MCRTPMLTAELARFDSADSQRPRLRNLPRLRTQPRLAGRTLPGWLVATGRMVGPVAGLLTAGLLVAGGFLSAGLAVASAQEAQETAPAVDQAVTDRDAGVSAGSSPGSPGSSVLPASASGGYSEQVVAKADQVLADAGLRRQGRSIVSIVAGELARDANDLVKQQRSVQQIASQFTAKTKQYQQVSENLRQLNVHSIELNERLIRFSGDVAGSNRLVALINRNTAVVNEVRTLQNELRDQLQQLRRERVQAESDFAGQIVQLRQRLDDLLVDLTEKLADRKLSIAADVLHVNFQTAAEITLADLVGPLDRRIKQLERQVQQEAITLVRNDRSGWTLPVSIGVDTVEMELDASSTLTILPAETASELGIQVPAAATEVRLVLADGGQWQGHLVTIAQLRVGGFEASDVEAAVLEPAATGFQPTLGQSFLGLFQHTVDLDAGVLQLTRLAP